MHQDLKEIKKIVIKALFSNEYLYDVIVLKGGTALELLNLNQRASLDIDLSLESDLEKNKLPEIEKSIHKSLSQVFRKNNLDVFDVKLTESPKKINESKIGFWGGYDIEFKINSIENINNFEIGLISIDDLRRSSKSLDSNQGRKFQIDISKFEFCDNKEEMYLDGYKIYIYTPIMLVYEKMRALCQQTDEYKTLHKVKTSPRPRDFYDIYTILEENHLDYIYDDLMSKNNLSMLKEIFNIKRVPLDLMIQVAFQREFHRSEFNKVEDTVLDPTKLESFDFYFDYTTRLMSRLYNQI